MHQSNHLWGVALMVLVLVAKPGVIASKTAPPEIAEACLAQARATEAGQRVEAFLRAVLRDLGPAGALTGDEAQFIDRLTESSDPAVRAAEHTRLHAVLGARLDEPMHAAIHTLADQVQACLDASSS